MDITDWFMVALTFITGVVIGGVIYVTSFKPVYAPENIAPINEVAEEYSVIGKQYGGFREIGNSPTFQILGDGSYTYRGVQNEVEATRGKLPRALFRRLQDNSTELLLAQYAEPQTKSECRSNVDGIDYRYEFLVEGNRYQLDTCQTSLSYTSDLQQTFSEVWEYFRDPSTYTPPKAPSIQDIGTDFIRQHLSPFETDGEDNVS